MSFNFFGMSHDIPRNEQIVNKLMGQLANELSKKCKMKPIGITVGMPSGVVKLLGLEFDIIGPLSKNEIRKILISSSEEFIVKINNDIDIRPYLEFYPFKKENIEIVLYFNDKNYSGLNHPHIGVASIRKNILQYKTLITTDIPRLQTKDVETEEEALRALKEED